MNTCLPFPAPSPQYTEDILGAELLFLLRKDPCPHHLAKDSAMANSPHSGATLLGVEPTRKSPRLGRSYSDKALNLSVPPLPHL